MNSKNEKILLDSIKYKSHVTSDELRKIFKLDKVDSIIESSVMSCEYCGSTGDDVKYIADPYMSVAYQDYNEVSICDSCYQKSADDV